MIGGRRKGGGRVEGKEGGGVRARTVFMSFLCSRNLHHLQSPCSCVWRRGLMIALVDVRKKKIYIYRK